MKQAVHGLSIREGKVLLVRKKQTWILPGGKIEKGESDLECLYREFKEELPDIRVQNVQYYGSFEGITPHSKISLATRVYRVDLEGNLNTSLEINEAKWVNNFSSYNISDITSKIIDFANKEGLI